MLVQSTPKSAQPVTVKTFRVAEVATQGTPVPVQPVTVKFFRVAEVATLLEVHRTTVYRAIDSGALGAVRLGQGRGGLRVPAPALDEFLTASQVRPTVLVEVA